MHHAGKEVAVVATVWTDLLVCCSATPSIKEWYLDKYCSRIPKALMFPCPAGSTPSGAARLTFRQIPQSNCSVRITLPSNCRGIHALYLNFKRVQLADTQILEVFHTTNHTRTLVKRLTGRMSEPETEGVSSVAHFLTTFHHSPSLAISFRNRELPVQQRSDKIIMDLTPVLRDPSNDLAHCEQLDGYIPETLCRRGLDRVSCPAVYSTRVGFEMIEQPRSCDKDAPKTLTVKGSSPEPEEITEIVKLHPGQVIGTLEYVLHPLPQHKKFYRVLLGDLELVISDRSVRLTGPHANQFTEIAQRSPARSLTHPNCSAMNHWVSFSARNTDSANRPFIKFGYGYKMTPNILFQFNSKTSNNHDAALARIGSVSVEVLPNSLIRKQLSRSMVLDYDPLIIPDDKMNLSYHIRDNVYLNPSDLVLCPTVKALYHKVQTAQFTEAQLNAVVYSLETKGCTLYNTLERKASASRNRNMAYIRIPLHRGRGNAPGQEMVLEVWPRGNYSPIHNHGNAAAVIKVLRGSIKSEWYNHIVNNSFEMPVLVAADTLRAGDVTWMRADLFQTHRLHNERNDTPVITLQVYGFENSPDAVHEEFFFFVRPGSPYVDSFFPTKDAEIRDIVEENGIIMQEYRTQECRN